MKLAVASAGEAVFDWTMADDSLRWDGALDILSFHSAPDAFQHGATLRTWMGRTGREELDAVIREMSFKERPFEIEFETASAMGSV